MTEALNWPEEVLALHFPARAGGMLPASPNASPKRAATGGVELAA